MITSLFSGGSSSSATPKVVYDNPRGVFTEGRTTPTHNVQYFVNPDDIASYTPGKLSQLDRLAEVKLVQTLRNECENQMMYKQRLRDAAQGWFYQDPDRMQEADAYPMPSCERLTKLGLSR